MRSSSVLMLPLYNAKAMVVNESSKTESIETEHP